MQAIDNALLRDMIGWGEALPPLWAAGRGLTELGGATWLIPMTLFTAALLAFRGHRRHAVAFLFVTLGGRLLIELLKWLLARQRPDLIAFPMTVHSLSFPSGHAGNSTVVYLTFALIVAPLWTHHRWPIWAAGALAALIGLTRPILGVHWPTDVVAGWSFGIAWTLGAVWILDRWTKGRPASRPPRSP